MSWPAAALGDHVEILSGFAFKSERFNTDGVGLPLVRIRDVLRGRSDTHFAGSYQDQFLIKDGDILIGMDGEFNAAKWAGGPALLNQRVCRITPRGGKLDANFLLRLLPSALKAIEDRTAFVTVKHLSAKDIREIRIALPPLDEQRQIAVIIDQADDVRHKRREALSRSAKLRDAFFHQFIDAGLAADRGWPTEELSKVVRAGTIVTYGMVQAGDEYEGGVPYIRTGDIVDGEIVVEQLRRADPAIAAKFDRARVSAGDIVMSIRATVGTTAMVPSELEGANLTQGTAKIAPGHLTDPIYLLDYLRSAGAQRWISKQVKGATFREITLSRLRELPVTLPPPELQLKYRACADALGQSVSVQKSQLNKLDSLFASLVHRAFNGELTTKTAEGELARVC